MPVREPTLSYRIVKRGPFKLEAVHNAIRSFLDEHQYDVEVKENTVKNKPQGEEVLLKINGDKKLDDYCKLYISTDFVITNLEKVKNHKSDIGDVRLIFKGWIVLDYRHNWEINKIGVWLRDNIYHKYFIKTKINTYYHVKVYEDAMELFAIVKDILGMT